MTRSPGGDRGSLSIELSILLPGFILMALLATMFGREAVDQSAIDHAAHDAARAATVARDYNDAVTLATNAATATLGLASYHCDKLTVDVYPHKPNTAWSVPLTQPSNVTVRVSCDVSMSDLDITGLVKVTLVGQSTSPLDLYRTRS